MKNNPTGRTDRPQPVLFIGIDWADQQHEAYVIDGQGRGRYETIAQTPEAIDTWVAAKLEESGGGPIGIILEQSRGALIHGLMFREKVVLYPVNPKQFARYRESFSNAGCKDDPSDARMLARMLCERYREMRHWQPDDEQTRTLARFCQVRRQLVDERTRLMQQLEQQLKGYYPSALELKSGTVGGFQLEVLKRWPDPRQLRHADRRILRKVLKAHGYQNEEQREQIIERLRSAKLLSRDRALIEPVSVAVQSLAKQIPVVNKAIEELEAKIAEEMNRHPDAELFTALPGAGKALAPRLLTAFGSDRNRYATADEIATFSGIAPVTKQSGKTRIVHRRYACPKFLRQTFHEFADHARKWCPWSRAYYQLQRSRGMKHHAALRKLATRWIRILFRVWKSRTAYNPGQYLQKMKSNNPAIIPFLKTTTGNA